MPEQCKMIVNKYMVAMRLDFRKRVEQGEPRMQVPRVAGSTNPELPDVELDCDGIFPVQIKLNLTIPASICSKWLPAQENQSQLTPLELEL
jgi:hypothetical protein